MTVRPRLRNPNQLLRDSRSRWEASGFTNSDSRDTKIRSIAQPLIEEVYNLSEENQRSYLDLQLGTAVGSKLDDIGRTLGKPRFESNFANVFATESSLAFYVRSGNFGDINSGNDILLPSTVTIWVEGNQNDKGERVTYQLNNDVTLSKTNSLQFVSATCVTDGPLGNVSAQALRNHSFTDYTDSSGSLLKVVNFFPILNGTARETDDHYRARLLNHFRSMISSNYDAIQMQALSVPGVRTTQLKRGYFGIGTGAVFVNGPEGRSNTRMVQGVQAAISSSTPPGGEIQALPMVEVTVYLEIAVKSTQAISAARQQQVEAALRKVFLRYIRESLNSSYLDFEEFKRRAAKELASMGVVFSKDGFFKKIYISKSYGGESVNERNLLSGTSYTLDSFEYPSLGSFTVAFE